MKRLVPVHRLHLWVWTPKIGRATVPFLKFDAATGDFLKIDRGHGNIRDKRHKEVPRAGGGGSEDVQNPLRIS